MKVTRNFLIKTNNLFRRKYLMIIYILRARGKKLNFNSVFLSNRTEKYVLIGPLKKNTNSIKHFTLFIFKSYTNRSYEKISETLEAEIDYNPVF